MVASMTGFGHGVVESVEVRIDVELRSVNSRFLDCVFKLPRAYAPWETELRKLIEAKIGRGRVEIYVSRVPKSKNAFKINFNQALFESYLDIYGRCLGTGKSYSTKGGLNRTISAEVIGQLLARKEILDYTEQPVNGLREFKLLAKGFEQALKQLAAMRLREGTAIGADVAKRGRALSNIARLIEQRAKLTPAQLRERLIGRIRKLTPLVKIEDSRLIAEVAMLCDKVDVTEELVRLKSHVAQLKEIFRGTFSGKKLEFLLQEIGREFNTTASKTQDAQVQTLVMKAKYEIEKMKEQVQNLE